MERLCVVTLLALIYGAATYDSYRDGVFYRTDEELTDVPTDIPEEATKVYLSRNQITELKAGSFSHLNNCTDLELPGNAINSIETGTFIGLGKLTELGLHYNQLKEIRNEMWKGLESLKILFLYHNEIRVLPGGVFQSLPKLENLYLHRNKMIEIQGGAFSNLLKLNVLMISYNELTTLPEDVIIPGGCPDEHPEKLELYSHSNPWVCDQMMCWMKQAIADGWLEIKVENKCSNYPDTPLDEVDLGCPDN